MLAVRQTILRAVLLCSFLTPSLAKGERERRAEYDPAENRRPGNVTGLASFYNLVGSYYNATVEVDYISDFPLKLEPPEQCKELRNVTTTIKYNAFLGVQEHRKWNPGNNSLQFWLTLLPSTSPSTSIFSAMDQSLSARNSSHVYSTEKYGSIRNQYLGPDYFNSTITQVPGGAYNITESWKAELGGAYWQDIEMPVCNATEYKNQWRVRILEKQVYEDDWTGPVDYHYPRTSLQFDGNTANLTYTAFFQATPERQPNYKEVVADRGATWNNGTDLIGRISFNFSGVLDEYHSDILSLDNSLPV